MGAFFAMADLPDDRFGPVAARWAATDEFDGHGDPAELSLWLRDLARLSRNARSRGEHLYCWICL